MGGKGYLASCGVQEDLFLPEATWPVFKYYNTERHNNLNSFKSRSKVCTTTGKSEISLIGLTLCTEFSITVHSNRASLNTGPSGHVPGLPMPRPVRRQARGSDGDAHTGRADAQSRAPGSV